jgi:hypothetical protein
MSLAESVDSIPDHSRGVFARKFYDFSMYDVEIFP